MRAGRPGSASRSPSRANAAASASDGGDGWRFGLVVEGRLDALAAARPPGLSPALRVVGYTTEMDEYMAAAGLLVGKPGGLTSSEALARGLALVIVHPIPGQEERNADHLLEAGAAIRCNNLPALAWKISAPRRPDAAGRDAGERPAARAAARGNGHCRGAGRGRVRRQTASPSVRTIEPGFGSPDPPARRAGGGSRLSALTSRRGDSGVPPAHGRCRGPRSATLAL